jgi:hypothetical protein
MAPGTKAPLGGLQAVTVIPGHLQMGGTRTAAPFFAATRYARVLGCAAGLLVGVLGPPAVVGDLGSCPTPVVILRSRTPARSGLEGIVLKQLDSPTARVSPLEGRSQIRATSAHDALKWALARVRFVSLAV